MKKRIFLGLLILGLLFAASLAGAQSLLDNPDYKRAVELQRQAQAAYAEGDYDRAAELSRQAKQYAERSNNYVSERLLLYRANSLLKNAQERVAYFKSVGVQPERIVDPAALVVVEQELIADLGVRERGVRDLERSGGLVRVTQG